MAEDRKPFLLIGLGLAGVAGYQLLQKPKPAPPAPPITCPTGYHVEGAVCVQDPPPPPPSPATGYRVTATAGLIVRAGPGTQFARVGSLAYNTIVSIACQTTGQRIQNSAIWDRLAAPIAGYVSDWYVSTPAVGRYSPGLSICAGAPPPDPGGPPVLPPTGKAALNNLGQLIARMIVSTGCGWGDADYIVLARKATATASPRFGRVWIKDKYTWDGLGAPRSAINVITPGLLGQIADAGSVRRATIRNYGDGWIWEGGINAWGATVWDTAMQNVNRGPFAVLKAGAGWC